MVVENLFPPIPSEAILPLAGYLVAQGELGLPGVLAASTAGSVLGSVVLYELARYGGRPFAAGFLRFARQDPKRLDQAEAWFARRGAIVVLVGRCVPGVRSLVALPAGALRMDRRLYVLLTVVGTLVWNGVLVGAGWLLGNEWERVADVVGVASKPILVALAVAAAAAFVWHRRRRARLS
jgi:membrane protein DedA with SNARE-associated domain